MNSRWVAVAGAAGDIGQALAARAKSEGFSVLAIDKSIPGQFVDEMLQFDLTSLTSEKISQIVTRTQHLNLHHLFAVVGGALSLELLNADRARVPIEVARETFELNVLSVIGLVDALLPAIRRATHDRSITAVSSINALGGYGAPAYSASKAALSGLVAALSDLLAPEGIRVNAVALGTTLTANLVRLLEDQGRTVQSLTVPRRFPFGRPLSAEEAADAVFEMATNLRIVTGQTVIADAGQTLRRL